MISISDIPFDLNTDELLERLKIKHSTDDAKEFEDLVCKAREIGKPKALYKVSFIDEKGDNTITLDGVTFTSLALRKNLDLVERVFPYIATCGTEIDDIEIEQGDFQKNFWISFLKLNLLEISFNYLKEQLDKRYKVSKLSTMNPGSGEASVWPFEQQKELFSIIGEVEDLIGVRLTESLIMVPDMSVSGILFPTETNFQSCQLCHRENCCGRRAPFDKKLWESMNQT